MQANSLRIMTHYSEFEFDSSNDGKQTFFYTSYILSKKTTFDRVD